MSCFSKGIPEAAGRGVNSRNTHGTGGLCYVTGFLPQEQDLLLLPGPAQVLHTSQSCPFDFGRPNCACDEGTSMWRAHVRCRALFCSDCIE